MGVVSPTMSRGLHRLLLLVGLLPSSRGATIFLVSHSPTNDLMQLLRNKLPEGLRVINTTDASAAISTASENDAVLLLADGYPTKRTVVPPNLTLAALARGFRAYVEVFSLPLQITNCLDHSRLHSSHRAVLLPTLSPNSDATVPSNCGEHARPSSFLEAAGCRDDIGT